MSLHQGDDQARIDPAREEGTDRYIGDHPGGHRIRERLLQPVGHLLVGSGDGIGPRLFDGVPGRPVGPGRRQVAGPVRSVEGDELTGKELDRAPVDGVGSRDAVVPEIQGDRVAVDPGVELRQRAERLQLRGEGQLSAGPSVVEGLFAEAVPGQVQPAVSPVPQSEGEHPLAGLERRFEPPGLDGAQQDLGIRSAPEGETFAHQALTELAVVVDLAVEDEDPPPVTRHHGLGALGAELHHGQSTVAQGHAMIRIGPDPVGVGSPVDQCSRHGHDAVGQPLPVGPTGRFEDAGDPAHGAQAPARRDGPVPRGRTSTRPTRSNMARSSAVTATGVKPITARPGPRRPGWYGARRRGQAADPKAGYWPVQSRAIGSLTTSWVPIGCLGVPLTGRLGGDCSE